MSVSQTGGVQLRELFSDAGVEIKAQLPELRVTDITADSGRVKKGGLFLACQGLQHHGLEFAAPAVAAGAAAIAWEPGEGWSDPVLPEAVASFAVPGLSDEVGVIADRFFASPSEQIVLTGVTGTNGKTTTAWLASQALAHLGCEAGYMGTIGYGVGGKLEPSALTTPGVIAVHRRLRKLADAGATAVVMEVSSHGLDQGRIDAVRVTTAAFTNLSRDHLDYHGDLAAYRAAKAKLFALPSIENAVINIGDPFGAELVRSLHGRAEILAVALADRAPVDELPALLVEVIESDADGLLLRFSGEYGVAEMRSSLWGHFNAENLLVAAGILLAHGYNLQQAVDALALCQSPPGRMQVVRGKCSAPLVVVDFAHTPDALDKALGVLREHCSGAVSVVFGCGGERDMGKRGEMGSVAERLADRIIVTDDNPRNEDPDAIVAAILAGIAARSKVEVVRNRALAIATAVNASGAGDAVLIAGKGSENYQLVSDRSVPFSDVEEAVALLGELA
jgi:UDP-N-acetylmuramoyl-L-alanyl-D-glutamate--2,6-diaminopimelate ligase